MRVQTQIWECCGYGVSWELIIDLANTLPNISPWINIPEKATDNYIKELAKLWYNTYTGSSRIYIEYSNECWNGEFSCYHYCVAQAKNYSSMNHVTMDNWEWYGHRVCEIRQIWDSVYGEATSD